MSNRLVIISPRLKHKYDRYVNIVNVMLFAITSITCRSIRKILHYDSLADSFEVTNKSIDRDSFFSSFMKE